GDVEDGENVFLVRGDLDDPAHLRAHITTHEAVGMSVEDSLARLEKVNRRLALRLRPE
ncbi:XVIPCD domain-containing protein, partial [uncultured Xanthomonas sp.]